jgi:Ca-activated chloride channel family protein
MRFESPWALLVLLIIPVLVYFYFRKKRRPGLRFSSTRNLTGLAPSLRQRFIFVPLLIRVLVLVFLTLALARPQMGKEYIKDKSKVVAIEMLVDRSSSMSAEMNFSGLQLNRLETVKRVFKEFVDGNKKDLPGRPSDLIGMVVFSRYADTLCPLTLSHEALNEFLKQTQLVNRREEDGTAIGDALALAAARLRSAEEELSRQNSLRLKGGEEKSTEIKSKVIILLTDGQNNSGKRTPLEAAKLAREWGIKIYTIGIGGGETFQTVSTIFGNFKQQVATEVDETTLSAIAEETGGLFRLAGDADALRSVYKEIDALEKSEVEVVRYMDYKELLTPFALLALFLLVLEVVLANTFFRKVP